MPETLLTAFLYLYLFVEKEAQYRLWLLEKWHIWIPSASGKNGYFVSRKALRSPLGYFRCSQCDSERSAGREGPRWALSGFSPAAGCRSEGRCRKLWSGSVALWCWGSGDICCLLLPQDFCAPFSTLPALGNGAGLLQALRKGQTQQSTPIKHIFLGYNSNSVWQQKSWRRGVPQICVQGLNLCLLRDMSCSSFVCTKYNGNVFSEIWNIHICCLFPSLFIRIV